MAPTGTKVGVCGKPGNRRTYACHGTEGWYIEPSSDYYRCFECFMPVTCKEKDADAVKKSRTRHCFLK